MTHHLNRRHFMLDALVTGATMCGWPAAQARPATLRLVCGYPPGGSVDIVCRKLAEKLTAAMSPTIIVDNKPGAAGRLAVDEVRKAAPDGATVLITPASVLTLYPHVYRHLAYNPFTDLTPVSAVCLSGFALAVGPKVPATVTTVEDFARWCRAEPQAAQCANPGAGSMPHLMAMQMAQALHVDISHIPYRGGSLAMQAAAAGEVAAALSTEASARPLHEAGKLRVLATTWTERSPFFPHSSTFQEQGLVRLAQREWFGAFMPSRTPPEFVQAAAKAIHDAMQEKDVRDTWERTGLVVESNTPQQLSAAMQSEHDFWAQVVRASGFTPEA